jgi:hypothetical protein
LTLDVLVPVHVTLLEPLHPIPYVSSVSPVFWIVKVALCPVVFGNRGGVLTPSGVAATL